MRGEIDAKPDELTRRMWMFGESAKPDELTMRLMSLWNSTLDDEQLQRMHESWEGCTRREMMEYEWLVSKVEDMFPDAMYGENG